MPSAFTGIPGLDNGRNQIAFQYSRQRRRIIDARLQPGGCDRCPAGDVSSRASRLRHPDTNPISHSPIAPVARANVRDPERQTTFPPSSATAHCIVVPDTRFRPISVHACAFRETKSRRTNNRSAWNTEERYGPFKQQAWHAQTFRTSNDSSGHDIMFTRSNRVKRASGRLIERPMPSLDRLPQSMRGRRHAASGARGWPRGPQAAPHPPQAPDQYCTMIATRRFAAREAASSPTSSGKLSARPIAARR